MATSKIFQKVPIQVPNKSGFNESHNHFFSAPLGTLIPMMWDFLLPNDEIDLNAKMHIQLPPMATDFYGRVEAKAEAFFVPCRILFGGWKDFYVNPIDGTTNPSNIDGQLSKYLIGALIYNTIQSVPYTSVVTIPSGENRNLKIEDSISDYKIFMQSVVEESPVDVSKVFTEGNPKVKAGSLLDYLGFKVSPDYSALDSETLRFSIGVLNGVLQNMSEQNLTDITNLLFNNSKVYFGAYDLFSEDFDTYVTTDLPSDFEFAFSFSLVGSPGYQHLRCEIVFNDSLFDGDDTFSPIKIPNILALLSYHKIFDDWYRDSKLQQGLFKRQVANSSASTSVSNMPWITSGTQDKVYFRGEQLNFANGHNLLDLHQRNWQKDYFTSATPEPQAGEASSVKFDVVDNSGEFTISSLRAANALQQWLDRNNIAGFRYGDQIYAQYGIYPSDAITDRAIYLGSTSVDVYNKSIYQQSGDGGTDTNNPFNAIGSKYSNPTGIGDGRFCNNYTVSEAGIVMVFFSLVPQAYYSTGTRRFFHYNDISDIAFPILAGVGDQEIYGRELVDTYSGEGDTTVFGYQQRYSEYKFIDDRVSGLLRDGNPLQSFALQRSFSQVPQLGSEFLEIPRDYLDQVSATSYKISEYGCWVNAYFDYKKSSTLPAYSIPTLEDMKYSHTVIVDKGGKRL